MIPLLKEFQPKPFVSTGNLRDDRRAFLDETVAFIGADPTAHRAINRAKGRCEYRTKEGRGCAIGRYIPDEKYLPEIDDRTGFGITDATNICIKYADMLPLEVQALGGGFLNDVQALHDGERYWSYSGLSEAGTRNVEAIIRDYILADY